MQIYPDPTYHFDADPDPTFQFVRMQVHEASKFPYNLLVESM